MTFWSGETIHKEASASGANFIIPYDQTGIDCASYKLSMGSEAYVTPQTLGRSSQPYGKKLNLSKGEEFWIPPGQFAFLATKETLNMPKDVLGFISVRTSKKYMGLVNVSGFHVDPGFQGKLVFAVFNAGPTGILLTEGEKLFLIWFASLDNTATKHNRIDAGAVSQTGIPSKLIQDMRGHPVTLQSVSEDFESIKGQIRLMFSVPRRDHSFGRDTTCRFRGAMGRCR